MLKGCINYLDFNMLIYFLFVLGFVFLIKGADYLVAGSSSIAKKYNVPDIVIGLTIVAFGTSMPELIVNLIASFNGTGDLAIGNILGSNIANILLILGISAMIHPLVVHKNTVWKELPFSLLAVVVLLILVSDTFLDTAINNVISKADGLVLLSFFAIFLYYTLEISKNNTSLESSSIEAESEDKIEVLPIWKSTFFILLGLVGLFFGGQWIVDGAVQIASAFGLSQSLIGLTVVAIGTSLPELATSAMAALKGKTDIAIGNVVGSNIFNILWILGISGIVNPIPFSNGSYLDLLVDICATTLLFLALFVGKKHTLEKWQGGIFVVLYVLYVVFLVIKDIGLI